MKGYRGNVYTHTPENPFKVTLGIQQHARHAFAHKRQLKTFSARDLTSWRHGWARGTPSSRTGAANLDDHRWLVAARGCLGRPSLARARHLPAEIID